MNKLLTYLIITHFIITTTGCEKIEIDRIYIKGLGDYSISVHEEIELSVYAETRDDVWKISDVEWIIFDHDLYSMSGNILKPLKIGKTKIGCRYKGLTAEKDFEIVDKYNYNIRIPNLEPPTDIYQINEGSCGEAILWTICNYFGYNLSHEEINKIGGDPGRGLYGNEIVMVLDSLEIPYNTISKASTWESTVDTINIVIIKNRNPIILGVKIYPDAYPLWAADHFILLTGTNTRNKIFYYNSGTYQGTINYSQLYSTAHGYSIVNKYNYLYAIEIILIQ